MTNNEWDHSQFFVNQAWCLYICGRLKGDRHLFLTNLYYEKEAEKEACPLLDAGWIKRSESTFFVWQVGFTTRTSFKLFGAVFVLVSGFRTFRNLGNCHE